MGQGALGGPSCCQAQNTELWASLASTGDRGGQGSWHHTEDGHQTAHLDMPLTGSAAAPCHSSHTLLADRQPPHLGAPEPSTTEGAQRGQRFGCYFVKDASLTSSPI